MLRRLRICSIKPLLSSVTSRDLVLVPCRLTVQDPEFWKGLQPVTFGPLPRLQSQVTVIGYPCAQPCCNIVMT